MTSRRKPIPKTARRSRKFGKGGGRPTNFRNEFIAQVEELVAKHDYTDGQIADFLGQNPSTIWRWKQAVPEFGRAFARGEAQQVKVLEAAAFHRATGYSHKAVKIFPPRAEGEKPIIVPYEEVFPPDVAAIKLLLQARRPQIYRDRVEHSGDPAAPVQFIMVNRPKKGGVRGA